MVFSFSIVDPLEIVVKAVATPSFLFALVADLDLLRDFELALLAVTILIFGNFCFLI